MTEEEINAIRKNFQITEDEFEFMYKQAEILTFSGIKPAQERPTAVLTGGQPGAGKTGLMLKTKQEFAQKDMDIVSFDLDSYRCFYKNAGIIARDYPEFYADITGKAAGKVMERLSEKAIKEGYNFILEGTMGKSVYTLDVLKDLGADFNIVARLMAVSREESLLSIFERYIEMRKSMGIGRLTTIESHDSKYDNFPKVASTIEARNVEVEVYERSKSIENISRPQMTYKTKSNSNIYSSVEEALQRGRQTSRKRCLSCAESRLEDIKNDILCFKDDIGLVMEFEKLESIIKGELNIQNNELGAIE